MDGNIDLRWSLHIPVSHRNRTLRGWETPFSYARSPPPKGRCMPAACSRMPEYWASPALHCPPLSSPQHGTRTSFSPLGKSFLSMKQTVLSSSCWFCISVIEQQLLDRWVREMGFYHDQKGKENEPRRSCK